MNEYLVAGSVLCVWRGNGDVTGLMLGVGCFSLSTAAIWFPSCPPFNFPCCVQVDINFYKSRVIFPQQSLINKRRFEVSFDSLLAVCCSSKAIWLVLNVLALWAVTQNQRACWDITVKQVSETWWWSEFMSRHKHSS